MHLINSCLLLLGGIFLIANASPVELGLGLYERELEERAFTLKCVTCITQCAGWFGGCVAACGPFEIFTPIACANCIVIFGASQQCFQCVEKCEKAKQVPINGVASTGVPSTGVPSNGAAPAGLPSTESPPTPPLGRKLLQGSPGIDIDCDRLPNRCTGSPGSAGTPQGLCTIPQYARKVDNHGGECSRFGKASACDISVAANQKCEPMSIRLPANLRFVT